MKKDISLYLHIPFCIKKCNYCDFVSFADCDEGCRDAYITALCQEIISYEKVAANYRVMSVFIGGGTPSVLELEQIQKVFHALHKVWEIAPSAEITIEVNPGTVDKKKLVGYRQLGINRLSIGLQSTKKEELSLLGRIHNYDQFLAAFHMAREAGFDNINIDLMSGLPGQTIKSYRQTLNLIMTLKPEHISVYSLIIEEGTPFYADETVWAMLPDEETERRMYAFTRTVLEGYGYHRYEISNYAVSGRECRHNIVYWTDGAYLGIGLNASSYVGGCRFRNTADLDLYMKGYGGSGKNGSGKNGSGKKTGGGEKFGGGEKSGGGEESAGGKLPAFAVRENIECIDAKSHMEEYMFLGLRMMQGVSWEDFYKTFGKDIYEIYGKVLHRWEEEGMLQCEGGRIRLTEQGISVSNIVLADFLLSSQQ